MSVDGRGGCGAGLMMDGREWREGEEEGDRQREGKERRGHGAGAERRANSGPPGGPHSEPGTAVWPAAREVSSAMQAWQLPLAVCRRFVWILQACLASSLTTDGKKKAPVQRGLDKHIHIKDKHTYCRHNTHREVSFTIKVTGPKPTLN
jgi:hypothetical protein